MAGCWMKTRVFERDNKEKNSQRLTTSSSCHISWVLTYTFMRSDSSISLFQWPKKIHEGK